MLRTISNSLLSYSKGLFLKICSCRLRCTEVAPAEEATRNSARMDPDLEAKYEANPEMSYRQHPGKRNHHRVSLPSFVTESSRKLFKESDLSKSFVKDAQALQNFSKHRILALTDQKVRDLAGQILEDMAGKFSVEMTGTEKELRKAENLLENRVIKKLREMVYHWKPLHYNQYNSLLYLYNQAAANYAATLRVFQEIQASCPDFQPKTVFDLGSGVGTTIWAANQLWGQTLCEYFCVDVSEDMNMLAKVLLQGGTKEAEMTLKGVFFRHFFPASTMLKYELTVCSYTLLEMESTEERLKAVDALWEKTQDTMVIVERGTKAGFSAILEARDYILQKSPKEGDSSDTVLVAPCPHQLVCPKFVMSSKVPCSFPVKYEMFSLDQTSITKQELYSYVVLRKNRKGSGQSSWPRLISPVLPNSKHIVCRMCCRNGQLHEAILTKKKHSKHLYKCGRTALWGELLPLQIN